MFGKIITGIFDFLMKQLDGFKPGVSQYIRSAAVPAVAIVMAVEEAHGAGKGVEKKAAAVKALVDEMAKAGVGDGKKIDLPGKLEEMVAGFVVEAAVKFLNEKAGDFFAGAANLLK